MNQVFREILIACIWAMPLIVCANETCIWTGSWDNTPNKATDHIVITSGSYSGGRGGGAVRLTVTGVTTLHGDINANGEDSITQYYAGGSGESVWLTTGMLTGNAAVIYGCLPALSFTGCGKCSMAGIKHLL